MQDDKVNKAKLYRFKKDDRWGYKDEKGNIVIPPIYREAREFVEGVAAVRKFANWNYIDETGKKHFKRKFAEAKSFSEGLACVSTDPGFPGKWGYIDKTGKFVIKPKYEDATSFSNGVARVKKGNTNFRIDKMGYPIGMSEKEKIKLKKRVYWERIILALSSLLFCILLAIPFIGNSETPEGLTIYLLIISGPAGYYSYLLLSNGFGRKIPIFRIQNDTNSWKERYKKELIFMFKIAPVGWGLIFIWYLFMKGCR